MVVAVYPGTFDPVTNGHVDVAERASRIFEQVVVGIYEAPPKSLLFSTEERVALCAEALKHLRNVHVRPFRGLVVDFARAAGAQALLRGLRAGSDFEYEFEMAMMNKKLAPEVEAVFLMSSLEWQFLSSSRVKEVCALGANITNMVPPHVSAKLKERLSAKQS
ncbi:MAG: pantetheine-phosphate adenylyltransferase [Chloroflexi bacterium]|nr:pantetheine-phosphate adenylyltransferase [Chloroflexota bacterium]